MSEIDEAFAHSMAKSVEAFIQELKEMGINIPTPTTTNADRIRSMNDEELANLLVHNPWMTEKSALNWLKQEAKK